ncbi:MAG: hypothetical protein ACFE8P_08160, partial [Promethearchaeota archaeon]
TREAINYQYSVIFGYTSPIDDELTVGDVIGAGNLTKEKIKALYHDVIKFLGIYNAILRDYTGSELFSIEFMLLNREEMNGTKNRGFNIFPKSMILLPGQYKENECLLLALKPELGILNTHKSRSSINEISMFFSEIEEFIDRPQLQKSDKQGIMQRFASRFSKKLYGKLLEGKWNKKLVGLGGSEPTGKNMIQTYATITSDMVIKWHKKPREVQIKNTRYNKQKGLYTGKIAVEHLKYSISEPSINFIIENTIKFGIDLFELCNIGTLDEIQDEFISYLLNNTEEYLENEGSISKIQEIISKVKQKLVNINAYTNKFLQFSNEFITSGERGDLINLMEKYSFFINKKGKLEGTEFNNLLEITQKFIEQSLNKKTNLRVAELDSILNYLGEMYKKSYDIVLKSLPEYLIRTKLKQFAVFFTKMLKRDIAEQTHSKKITYNYINKLLDFLLNEIEILQLTLENRVLDEKSLLVDFKTLIKKKFDVFFSNSFLSIKDFIIIAEEKSNIKSSDVKVEIEIYKKFLGEINFLVAYITKNTAINRFLLEQKESEISDPVSFSNRFHRFLEKRIGGIKMSWKYHMLDWIRDYAKQFFKELDKKPMSLDVIIEDFLDYIDSRESEGINPEGFLKILQGKIEEYSNNGETEELMIFLHHYEENIKKGDIILGLIRDLIEEKIDNIEIPWEDLSNLNERHSISKDSFHRFIQINELQYFSKLIPLPSSIILKHKLSKQEKAFFREDLFHTIIFKYWHKHAKYSIADNFKTTFKEWEK